MKCSFDEYIADIKAQLDCNASDEYKQHYVTYNYTNEQIDSNLDYFKKQMQSNLSGYKALLFFSDYLNFKNFDYIKNEDKRKLINMFLDFAEPIYWGENEFSEYKDIVDLFLKSNE